jgi:hypothetical protein
MNCFHQHEKHFRRTDYRNNEEMMEYINAKKQQNTPTKWVTSELLWTVEPYLAKWNDGKNFLYPNNVRLIRDEGWIRDCKVHPYHLWMFLCSIHEQMNVIPNMSIDDILKERKLYK